MKQPTLQEQYNLLQEGKGNKDTFMKSVRRLFPNLVNNTTPYDSAVTILKHKQIISESIGGVVTTPSNPFANWAQFLNEEAKAEEKKPTKEVTDMETRGFDYKDKKNIDNLYGEAFLEGYYTEMKDPKNADKTVDELKEIVAKNMSKDINYYMKNASFGVKGIGYTDDVPGLRASKDDQMKPVKLKEGMYAGSDGDYEHDIETEVKANEYYDKGMQAYSEGDYLKADRYYKAALKAGSWLGWDEQDLPPYGDKHLEEIKLKENMIKLTDLLNENLSGYVDLAALREEEEKMDENARTDAEEEGYLDGMHDEKVDMEDKAKDKKLEKEGLEARLKEIETAGNVAALEAKMNAIDEEVAAREGKLAMVQENDAIAEFINPARIKEIQREIKELETAKKKYNKLYEKVAGKAYVKKEVVGEDEEQAYKDGVTQSSIDMAMSQAGMK